MKLKLNCGEINFSPEDALRLMQIFISIRDAGGLHSKKTLKHCMMHYGMKE